MTAIELAFFNEMSDNSLDDTSSSDEDLTEEDKKRMIEMK
jgi:hypothetical protein